ncbi:MAG: glutamate-5-semialdehyde dehydrogenase [Deltaproteobacteria bacterium]|nr:glutamate-5-semialdehyde dehydrogenase [Deltaproteobacteria bacterium]
MELRSLLRQARTASRSLGKLPIHRRDACLERLAEAIEKNQAAILAANAQDLAQATELSAAMRDRLKLDPQRLEALVGAIRLVRAQPDPLQGRREIGTGPSGIRVTKQRVPLGVIAVVFEARPNVTAECAALTLKSGNAVVLRGGKEALATNRAIAVALRSGLVQAEIDPAAVTFIDDPSRQVVIELLQSSGLIDLVIPRGGSGLMELVDAHARVPVIRHGQGICQVYLDEKADHAMAIEIADNAKTQRPGVCNAMETLLIHEARLADLLPELGARLVAKGVELRADPAAFGVLARSNIPARPAEQNDWDTEFLSLILAVRTVGGLGEALEHIEAHGTHHTAAIVTADPGVARRFLDEVDASCVLWNASTRFNDGGELGLGAEMGISTSKLHAYGPMSALELTAEKLVVYGEGQVRK